MNIEQKVSELELEIEAIKSQFAYLNARINLMDSRMHQNTIPVYDYDTLPKSANSTETD